MNRQSNIYTFIYSLLLVLAVGIVLSLVYQSLRPRQAENRSDDTKKQILAAALIYPEKGENISQLYNSHIKESFFVNSLGRKVKKSINPFETNIAIESKKSPSERLLPVFVCETESGDKYIIPCYGSGLWGPIWGYIALDKDGNTVYGAFFAHQGETPGLGAEIEKEAFRDQFKGKTIFDDGHFSSIAVVKNGKTPTDGQSWVNAVSGGTITSNGVQNMLYNSLLPYEAFFKELQSSDNK